MSTKNKSRPVFQLAKDLIGNSALQKELLSNQATVLAKYGVTPEQFETMREALSASRTLRFGPDFPWPPDITQGIVVDSIAPGTLVAKKSQDVTITGQNFPQNVTFTLSDPALPDQAIYFGTITSSNATQIKGTIYIGGQADFQYTLYVINIDKQTAGELDGIKVT
jgi:hypothetical protein